MSELLKMVVTIVTATLASSGLWTYIMKRNDKKDAKTKMLVGLGHDRIVCLGLKYISRGYITRDEYENLYDYLYVPYAALGGNGSAKHVMDDVNKLPIKN